MFSFICIHTHITVHADRCGVFYGFILIRSVSRVCLAEAAGRPLVFFPTTFYYNRSLRVTYDLISAKLSTLQ